MRTSGHIPLVGGPWGRPRRKNVCRLTWERLRVPPVPLTPEKQKMNGNRSVATERRIKRNLCINVVKLQYNGDLQIFTDLPKTADFFSSYLIIRLYAVAVLIKTTRRQACSLRDCYQHRNSGKKKKKNKSTKKTKQSIISCLCFRKYVIG